MIVPIHYTEYCEKVGSVASLLSKISDDERETLKIYYI